MRTLTKADIVESIYSENFLKDKTRLDIKGIVEDLFIMMKNAIVKEHVLLITGFGKFEAYVKSERKGRNPQTNEAITLPGRNVTVFRLSKKFRNELNCDTVVEE